MYCKWIHSLWNYKIVTIFITVKRSNFKVFLGKIFRTVETGFSIEKKAQFENFSVITFIDERKCLKII